MSELADVTALLHQARNGQREALDRLMPIVYATLRRLAAGALRSERRGHTLSATALANEAYLKLVTLERVEWNDRAHFFAVAAGAMRRILVNHANARNAQKRGGGAVAVDLDSIALATDEALGDVLAINDALERLNAIAPDAVRVVECRVFMGMTIEETAQAMRLSPATIKRHWTAARAWLTRDLVNGVSASA
jgi:RNA polymerase sigma factor (TIGR02999 family)